MKYTWISQGGFVFESAGVRLAVDPYLSDAVERKSGLTRLVEPVFSVDSLEPDAVFCTHDHMDHFDPLMMPELAKKYPECVIIGPESVYRKCQAESFDMKRVVKIEEGGVREIGPFRLTAIPAVHSDEFAVGLILETENRKVYLSGDSEYSEHILQSTFVAAEGADLAFICINGRMGNMNRDEALKVVFEIFPKRAHPMHYGLFAENTADPAPFVTACLEKGIDSFELIQGKVYEL